ncbi:MAG: hypothetical protein JWQ53_1413 [Klenkia sp.]|nr:hypothetical protein [Klenkia sp.]
MEQPDPLETRRRGVRRVRVVTAWLAGAAVVGTGALVVVVADQHPAAGTSSSTTQAPADEDRSTDPFGGPPSTGLGQAPVGGGSHASSGGS